MFFLGLFNLVESFLGGFIAFVDDDVDHVKDKGVVESFVFVENCVEKTIHTRKCTINQHEFDFCLVFWDNVEFLGTSRNAFCVRDNHLLMVICAEIEFMELFTKLLGRLDLLLYLYGFPKFIPNSGEIDTEFFAEKLQGGSKPLLRLTHLNPALNHNMREVWPTFGNA